MNTRLIAVGVLAVILLGAGGLLFYDQSQNKPSQTETSQTSPTPKASQKSILDLFSSGASQECTFDYKDETSQESSGTFYITKDKLRGDVTSKVNSKTTTFSMIRVGEDNYMWGTDLESGIKMKLSLDDLKSNEQVSSYTDLNQSFDYKCKGWGVDNSKFTPPANVKFTDFSAMMEGSIKSTATPGGETKMDPSVCASITDPGTRTACEKAVESQ